MTVEELTDEEFAKIVVIARTIADPPPPKLLKGFKRALPYLHKIIETEEEKWPSRKSLREDLERLSAAAETVRRLTANPIVRQFLRHGGDVPPHLTEAEAPAYFAWLAKRARAEADKVPRRGGVDLHSPAPDELSARELCAGIAVVAWRCGRDADIKHTGDEGQRICADLWALAGGSSIGESGSGWRRPLEVAKAAYLKGHLPSISDRFLAVDNQAPSLMDQVRIINSTAR
jgi:hypothetical protein